MIPIDKQCNWIQYYYKEKPFERRILCFQSWCMINESLANCVWQAGEILTCHDGWKVSDLILRRYYWYRKKGRVNFTATWAKDSTELFCSNLSILCRRCRPIQFLQARVLRSGELFGTRASCLLGSWITIANREHFKLRYPSLLRSSKEQKFKYIIHVYKHPII